MRQALYNKNGDEIVVFADRIDYLKEHGWSEDKPSRKKKPAKGEQETE